MSDREVLHASATVEWYTPPTYLEAARQVMGAIDLDPASCAAANQTVQAARFLTAHDDGLTRDWPGRVWLNPPYGRVRGKSSQGVWSRRLLAQYAAGSTTEAILLVNAGTGNRWFRPLWAHPSCFVTDRIACLDPEGTPAADPHTHQGKD